MSPAATDATAAPLSAVLAQFQCGATSLAEISETTGLPLDLVRVAVDRLVAMGRLSSERLVSGCPEDACAGCGFARTGGTACVAGPRPGSGAVLLRLTG